MRKFLAGLVAGAIAVCAGYALASRNSSGTYSLPAGNPVVSGTTIATSWANNTMPDIASEVTNSLDRNGRGGMLAALRGTDGAVSAPAFSFTGDSRSGLYRIGDGDLGWAISGGKKLELTSSLFTVTPNALFSGQLGVGAAALANQAIYAKGIGNHGYVGIDTDTPASKESGLNFFSSGAQKWEIYIPAGSTDLRIFDNGSSVDRLKVIAGSGVAIGATGTPISARYRGTTSWTPGSVAASTSTVKAITVTGAAAGADCRVTPPNAVGAFTSWCVVTADTCTVTIYNTLASGPSSGASGTWSCVVENP